MKIILIALILLLSGCSTSVDFESMQYPESDEILQHFDDNIFAVETLEGSNKPAWVKSDKQHNTYYHTPGEDESVDSKIYHILLPIEKNTFDIRSYRVDPSVNLFDKDPWYKPPVKFPKKEKLENDEDYIGKVAFKQIPNTPFFIIDQENSGIRGYKNSAMNTYDHLTESIKQANGTNLIIEEKFISRNTRLFFPAENGNIRSILLDTLIEYFEYGSPSYESKSEQSHESEAVAIRKSLFSSDLIDLYLNVKYETDVSTLYLDLAKIRAYIYNNLENVESLKKLSDMDYLWLIFRSATVIDLYNPSDYHNVYNYEMIPENESVDELIEKFADFIEIPY